MYDTILVPLDGSRFAEEIVPYARALSRGLDATLVLLRVVEAEDGHEEAERYVRELAQRLGAEALALPAQPDVHGTIVWQMEQLPRALAALTTHGRTGLLEAVIGSVALDVLHRVPGPVLLFRPGRRDTPADPARGERITTVVAPLDGSEFAERILPHAAEMAAALGASLTLVQVLTAEERVPPMVPAGDVLESSYLQAKTRDLHGKYGAAMDWETLHGDPSEAISRYLEGKARVMLAMSSHTRGGLRQTIFGSVTAECLRRTQVPILVYHPPQT